MTKKKRGHPDAEEILARPWCYYCERDFDDLKILISHQKAKHFKCERCGRRLNTAGGLSVHMTQVHKENLESVENALPNRSGLNVEIFGMEGIPDDIVQQHNQRVLTQFHQAEADRRATTGNPAPGAGASGPKKPKVEESGDLKARLAAFKAKKAAAAAAGGVSSGNGTPTGAGQASPGSATPQSPSSHVSNSASLAFALNLTFSKQQQPLPGYAPPQYPPQGSPPQPSFQPPYGQQAYGFPPQQAPYPQSHSPFNQGPPGYGPPLQQAPPGMGQYPPYPQPMPYAVSPPPGMFQQNQHQAPSPSQNGAFSRPPGLPAAPGLPQRPVVAAPLVNQSQMQQMHQGQYPGQNMMSNTASQESRPQPQDTAQQQPPTATEADVDELIANAAKESHAAHAEDKTPAAEPAATEKKGKKDKDKDKATRMVYDDNEVSPEEKMAKLPRYAFDPSDQEPETVLGDAVQATVTGAVDGPDDVPDSTGN